MSDEYHRWLKQQEALKRMLKPFEDAQRYIDPIESAYERLGINSTVRKILEEEDARRKRVVDLDSFKALESAAQTIARESRLQKSASENILSSLKNSGFLDSAGDIHKSIVASHRAHAAYEKIFRMPAASELALIAHEAMANSSLARHVQFSDVRLHAAMAKMHTPWLQLDAGARSAQAMADIFAIGKGISSLPPFDRGFTEELRLDLGDWRDDVSATDEYLSDPIWRSNVYVERGFNQELTNFTNSAFDEGLEIAGLLESEPAADVDDEEEDEITRARVAFEELRRFEVALRRFIEEAMQKTFGTDWMTRQLPSNMLDGWIEKKEKAGRAGEVEQALIDYADFSDYKAIIEKKDNWSQVFKHVFQRSDDVRESFQRLFPVRIATMHARLVTKDDHLLLLVETRRVLKAIKANSRS
jgi:hypothetical protein